MEQILRKIADKHDFQIRQIRHLTGGDINHVYAIETSNKRYVAKLNSATKFPGMFEAEAKGLRLLKATNSFRVPEVIAFGELDTTSYLLIEYIDPIKGSINQWSDFAEKLVKLHQTSTDHFGVRSQ